MRRVLLAGLLLTLPAALAPRAHAAWPSSPYTDLAVCTAANHQVSPAVAPDGAGGAFVTWSDLRTGAYDIYAQHVLASGVVDPAWPANGRALCTATGTQDTPRIVADGTGGAIVTWQDLRGGVTYDIYAQHVLAAGTVDPLWPTDGRALCTVTNPQSAPAIVADGSGGAIVAWQDFRTGISNDIYAQHVLAAGTVDPLWPTDGRALCTATGNQTIPAIVTDGAGGAIVGWQDQRSGTFDIYAQHVLASGAVDAAWPSNGCGVCTAASDQLLVSMIPDSNGGALFAWGDARSGTYDIYAQHVLASGAADAVWPANGRAVCAAAGIQLYPAIVTDGADGAIIAWQDFRGGSFYDIYAQHVSALGIVDATWPTDGRALCTAANDQTAPVAVADGCGGAIVAWLDMRNGVYNDIYAQHVSAAGAVDAFWATDGRAVCSAPLAQSALVIAPDGGGGAIFAWYDYRSGTSYDIYAQHVVREGFLGSPQGLLAGIKDVPNDNGGLVRVTWDASYLDLPPYSLSLSYNLFRQAPARAAAQAIAGGARLHEASDPLLRPGDFARTAFGATTYYWEYLAAIQGRGLSGYSTVAATTGDSIGAGNPKTLFMLQTYTNYGIWNSPPDSGYSVDNVPPVTPAPFMANYATGTAHLHWNPNPEADLAGYRLYRGIGAFTPSAATLVAALSDTGYADAASATYTYKLTAVDVHGNESRVATLTPAGITGVGDGPAIRELALAPASPNPAAHGTTLRFSLPAAANVSLDVYDAAGRLVRTLASGTQEAGEHAATWDVRDAGGRIVGAGLYFARLDAGGRTLVRRIAVTP